MWVTVLTSLLVLVNRSTAMKPAIKLRSGRSIVSTLAMGSSSPSGRGFSGGAVSSDAQTTMDHPLQRMHDCLKARPDLTKSIEDPAKCPHIAECIERMNEVTLKDVGLEKETLKSKKSYYMNIVSCDEHDIAVFVVPKGNTLPVHDHPGMTVASKLLHGSLEVTSFNKVEAHEGLYSAMTEIKNSSDDTWTLTPTQGNLHQFRALTSCVILDVLTPPYDNVERKCTFYQVKRAITNSPDDGVVLWSLIARPSYWMPDEDQILYNAHQYYQGFKVQQ